MIDTNAVFRAWLVADPAIAALVGDRVCCPDLPKEADVAGGDRYITFGSRGGIPDVDVPLLESHLQVKVWALQPQQAREVWRAIFDRVHGKTNIQIGGGTIKHAEVQVDGQDVTDPDTGWATVVAFLAVTFVVA